MSDSGRGWDSYTKLSIDSELIRSQRDSRVGKHEVTRATNRATNQIKNTETMPVKHGCARAVGQAGAASRLPSLSSQSTHPRTPRGPAASRARAKLAQGGRQREPLTPPMDALSDSDNDLYASSSEGDGAAAGPRTV